MTMYSPAEQLVEDVAVVYFGAIMRHLAQKIVADIHESRKLAEMRDCLLPKQLRGAVCVSAEAELKLGAM